MHTGNPVQHKKLSKENWTGLAFIAPAVILLFIFLLIPFLLTIGNSFTNYNIYEKHREHLCLRDPGGAAAGVPCPGSGAFD